MKAKSSAWEGFKATGYEINWSTFGKAPLTEIGEDGNRSQTTALVILRAAIPHRFPPLKAGGSTPLPAPPREACELNEAHGFITIKATKRLIRLNSDSDGLTANLVAAIIRIDQLIGDVPFHPVFFYYERDYSLQDIADSFSFFVVNGDRIVLDRVTFSRYSMNGFDEKVFDLAFKVEPPMWAGTAGAVNARIRSWYRRFYEETEAGRFMAMRQDVDLYHYLPDWKHRALIAAKIEQVARSTSQVQTLLICVIIALVVIAISLWR
jgi:hypothetical protein